MGHYHRERGQGIPGVGRREEWRRATRGGVGQVIMVVAAGMQLNHSNREYVHVLKSGCGLNIAAATSLLQPRCR
jgi:hypothetical protein